jgi:hypothetical protein
LDLLRTYLEDRVAAEGAFSERLEADIKDLQAILAVPAKDVAAIQVPAGLLWLASYDVCLPCRSSALC